MSYLFITTKLLVNVVYFLCFTCNVIDKPNGLGVYTSYVYYVLYVVDTNTNILIVCYVMLSLFVSLFILPHARCSIYSIICF